MEPERQLDVRGKACPIPVLELARAVRQMREGEVVRVQADDPAARADIVAWCEVTGHRLLEVQHQGAQVCARVQKSPPESASTRVASPG